VASPAIYVLARLKIVEERVRGLVAHRRRDDPAPEDPFLGLYLSDEHVDRLLAAGSGPEQTQWSDHSWVATADGDAADAEPATSQDRLRSLARSAGLDGLDIDLLLVALAPDLDSRFERLYGYLNDDVTRRRATVGLSLELSGASPWSAAARSRFSPGAPLISAGIVLVEETDRPFLTRSLRVPDRVTAHLLGDDRADSALTPLLRPAAMLPAGDLAAALGAVLVDGVHLVYLRERPGTSGPAIGAAALATAGLQTVAVDLEHLNRDDDPALLARIVGREALLVSAGVVAGPV
jgi:hypothetical protein